MKRSTDNFSKQKFDVLVIGGGIHGAVTAWDAAQRGLSVALIERGDFGCATSQNSLKIIHGGLRYLQDGNLPRIRKMAYERTTWMKIAPHLIHPLPCLTPTQKKFSRSRLAMRAALTLNDIISFDRNRLGDSEKHLPKGRILSPHEYARLLPGYNVQPTTGAATWSDAQIFNSERLLLAFILSAVNAGAEVANYVEAVAFLQKEKQITGVQAKDNLSGEVFDIHADVIINCAGAWVNQLLERADVCSNYAPSIAMNLIVDKVWSDVAAALPSRPAGGKRSQILLFVPWQNKTMIGTWHIHWNDSPDSFKLSWDIIQDFINEINTAHPKLNLTIDDIHHITWGFLPIHNDDAQNERVKLTRDDQIIDHQIKDGLSGLISVVSVKYTTARVTAEDAVNLAVSKLVKRDVAPCRTHQTPVIGGQIDTFNDFLKQALEEKPLGVDPDIMKHLAYTYGSEYNRILDYIKEQPSLGERLAPNQPVIAAEIVHAARHEMAMTLLDLIKRRTELGTGGLPSPQVLEKCADVAGRELGWSGERITQEINSTIEAYPIQHIHMEVA